jgi:hypothetical protein
LLRLIPRPRPSPAPSFPLRLSPLPPLSPLVFRLRRKKKCVRARREVS